MQVRTTSSEFRLDINGLRAWAVVAVILYHFGVPGFDGGFIGVDVFFVISGFLMTGIVVGKLSQGEFSIIDFYLARAKRIIPALAVLCVVLVALGWFVLQSAEYKQLGSHAVYSLLFVSNIEFWKAAGYFDASSHTKWFLHTWSLSVEWQFYVLLPVILYLVCRVRPGMRAQLWTLGAGMLLSLAVSVYLTQASPTAAFFLLPARAWEMLCGGIVWMLHTRSLAARLKSWAEACGLLMIVLAVVMFDKYSPWPGFGAMVPVAGAMMVLLANRNSPFTTSMPMQWLGDRSYSLYLWHWPICVALAYVELRYDPFAIAVGLAATLLAGHLSYIIVETRTRKLFASRERLRAAIGIAALILLAVAPAVAIWKQHGVPGRFSERIELVAGETKNYNPRREQCHIQRGSVSPSCKYGSGDQKLIVLGDSHAGALVSGVAAAFAGRGVEVTEWSYGGCPFIIGAKKTPADVARQPADYKCSEFIAWAEQQLATVPSSVPLILINRYASTALGKNEEHEKNVPPQIFFSKIYAQPSAEFMDEYAREITRTACSLSKQRPVYLMRPIPEMGLDVPQTLARRMSFGMKQEISIPAEAYRSRNAWVWAAQNAAREQCGVQILDPTASLCRNGQCYGSHGGQPLYHDDDHLSEFGNKLLVPMYRKSFAYLLPQALAHK